MKCPYCDSENTEVKETMVGCHSKRDPFGQCGDCKKTFGVDKEDLQS